MVTLGFLGVVIGVLARRTIVEFCQREVRPLSTPPEIKLPPPPEEVAGRHLSWADQECQRVIEEHIKALDSFFADCKKNTRGFADDALGWGSKWRLVADHVPFTSGRRNEAFIRERFHERIFSPTQLEVAVKQVVANYVKHMESIEGQMLVRIRMDMANFPSSYPIATIDETKLRKTYDEALSRAIDAAGTDLRSDLGTELILTIAGGLLTQVAIKLGLSAGILGAGAASSWATFGIGLVVGIIIDSVVSWIWDWYADPAGSLSTRIDEKLDEIHRLIVDGSDGVTGLRERLRQFSNQRAGVRSRAVLTLLRSQ
jgi:hypothetical protein